MKIKTDDLSHVIREQAQKGGKQKEATKFGEILQRTMDNTGAPVQKGTGARATAGVQGVQVSGVGAIGAIEEEQGPILERVEQLLDTLEEYQQNLGSASSSSEALKPLVDHMEEHNKSLAAILLTLPDGDALKDILNRVLITSVVEVEKFKRGDYS
jgi:heterodisulfide reductase subunit C